MRCVLQMSVKRNEAAARSGIFPRFFPCSRILYLCIPRCPVPPSGSRAPSMQFTHKPKQRIRKRHETRVEKPEKRNARPIPLRCPHCPKSRVQPAKISHKLAFVSLAFENAFTQICTRIARRLHACHVRSMRYETNTNWSLKLND